MDVYNIHNIHNSNEDNMSGPQFTEEVFPDGVVLNNYTKRVPSVDGKYVVVTTHSERVEMIPQPPTPEELEAQAKAEKTAAIVVGLLGAAFLGLIGWVGWQENKTQRLTEREMFNRRQRRYDHTEGDR